jgi:3-oxoacyl-[acyl-carrier-protein] synthase II
MKRVAVTGIGLVTPIGVGAYEVFAQACAGISGIRHLTIPGIDRLQCKIGATVTFDTALHFDKAQFRMLDRVSHLAMIASKQAVNDASIAQDTALIKKMGVFFGTGMGGSESMDEGYQTFYGERSDRIKPFTILMGMHNAPAGWIASELGLDGPVLTYSTACSSSGVALGEAWLRIQAGHLQIALAGGAEAPLSLGSIKAWEALHTLAKADPEDEGASCKPFSLNRSGMVLGEGSAMIVLEELEHARERGAHIYAEMVGYGLSTDAAHITRPTIEGQTRAMRQALDSANCSPNDIDAINAHGTGTAINDQIETAAIKEVFGRHAPDIPISATKSMHGHLLGATAALEFALTAMAIEASVVLPTINLKVADPVCDLDYVDSGARIGVPIEAALSSSFAFGGTNAVLVARRLS